jgi:hypothetical protein
LDIVDTLFFCTFEENLSMLEIKVRALGMVGKNCKILQPLDSIGVLESDFPFKYAFWFPGNYRLDWEELI